MSASELFVLFLSLPSKSGVLLLCVTDTWFKKLIFHTWAFGLVARCLTQRVFFFQFTVLEAPSPAAVVRVKGKCGHYNGSCCVVGVCWGVSARSKQVTASQIHPKKGRGQIAVLRYSSKVFRQWALPYSRLYILKSHSTSHYYHPYLVIFLLHSNYIQTALGLWHTVKTW